jgi:hypothetical protein
MEKFIKAMDELPFIVKILLALFVDIIVSIYRIVRGVAANDTTALVIGIVTCFIPFMNIIDLVLIVINKNYWYYTSTKA